MGILGCQDQPAQQTQANEATKDTVKQETVKHDTAIVKEPHSFQRSLQSNGLSFTVYTTGEGSLKQLFIRSEGWETKDQHFELGIEGTATDARVADLNSDGFPELLVFTQSAGSGSYANVIAFSANGRRSMSQVYFPPTGKDPKLSKGYMGHDSFSVNGSTLIQEFPVYKEGDANSNPTGGVRRVQYKLVDGEASRKFVATNISDSSPK